MIVKYTAIFKSVMVVLVTLFPLDLGLSHCLNDHVLLLVINAFLVRLYIYLPRPWVASSIVAIIFPILVVITVIIGSALQEFFELVEFNFS